MKKAGVCTEKELGDEWWACGNKDGDEGGDGESDPDDSGEQYSGEEGGESPGTKCWE
jgi:hypothetical protein